MKNKILFIILCLYSLQFNIYAQSIQRNVIASDGGVFSNSAGQISFTVGEAIVTKLSSGSNVISQGFQQGKKTDSTMLYLLVYLEGYYSTGYTMQPALYNQGQISDQNIADTILVELHPATNPNMVAAQTKTVLFKNANANCMMHVNNGNYYVVIKHRNHVETWSAIPVNFNGISTYHDFTWAASQAYGNNLVEIDPGIFAIHTGDMNQDENVDLLDLGILENGINNFQYGYLTTDINGDGNVDLLDAPFVENNIKEFIYSVHP